MLASPILHCKTFNCDFRNGLLFAPINMNIAWAKENYILPTTDKIEHLYRPRWVVFTNTDLVIVGMTTIIDIMAQRCGYTSQTESYDKDIENRRLPAFIGYAIQKKHLIDREVCFPSEQDLCDLYFKMIPKRWNESNTAENMAKTEFFSYKEYSFSGIATIDNKTFFCLNRILGDMQGNRRYSRKSDEEIDMCIFKTVIRMALENKNEVSLCTNLKYYDLSQKSSFTLITTDNSNDTWSEIVYDRQPQFNTTQHSMQSQMQPSMNEVDKVNMAFSNAKQSQQGYSSQKTRNASKPRENIVSAYKRRHNLSMLTENDVDCLVQEEIEKKCRDCKYRH